MHLIGAVGVPPAVFQFQRLFALFNVHQFIRRAGVGAFLCVYWSPRRLLFRPK